jgi:hypothetical protein
MRLYVAGEEPNSAAARRNLQRICQRYLGCAYSLELVDVLQDWRAAKDDGVLVTPTLRIRRPVPMTLVGCLDDEAKVLAALGVEC